MEALTKCEDVRFEVEENGRRRSLYWGDSILSVEESAKGDSKC